LRRLAVLATVVGMILMTGGLAWAASGGPETRPYEQEEEVNRAVPRSNSASKVPSAHVPRPAGTAVAYNAAAKRSEGLSLRDQRTSNGGNSFSVEPPDQALCVSGTQVIEAVNDVAAVYSRTGGTPTSGPTSLIPFFNRGVAAIDRKADPVTFGPFISDPKCYFDPKLQRFFLTVLQLGTDPTTGDFDGTSFVRIAVSKKATPTTRRSNWYFYSLDVANAGGTDTTTGSSHGKLASHSGCPCFGDQPLIGADRYGFYITTNEFPIEGAGFNGNQIYAFDKAALTAGTLKVQRIESNNPRLAEGQAYSVQPATSPASSEWSTEANGTEYAMSALEFTGKLDNRIASWAFTNTQSLATGTPAVKVTHKVIASEVYGQPPAVEQKSGPYPLGQSLKDKLNLLNSNDDRMNQVVYSGGRTWGGVNTVVKGPNGPTTTGIAYFVVKPSVTTSGQLAASMSNQGYVAVNRNSVMYPSIGVPAGASSATMVFTLAGPGYYPSTAYAHLSGTGALAGPVTIYGAGTKPADGFTGYPQFGGDRVERWGDYSAAVADASGTVWVAAEYIPGTFGYPQFIANWGTAIGAIE